MDFPRLSGHSSSDLFCRHGVPGPDVSYLLGFGCRGVGVEYPMAPVFPGLARSKIRRQDFQGEHQAGALHDGNHRDRIVHHSRVPAELATYRRTNEDLMR